MTWMQRPCKAFHWKDKKWYHAILNSVDLDTQEAEVSFIGYKEKGVFNAIFVKPFKIPKGVKNFEPGSYCEAIYNGSLSSKFYSCQDK